jgi:hypothetical protein
MRFMMMVKASAATEAGNLPDETLIAAMTAYHEELAKAGVLLDAAGLRPTARGWRVRYAEGRRLLVEGPFAQGSDLVAGYTLIQVRDREEAMEWSRRFPAPHGALADGQIEVRQLYEVDDFGPNEAMARFRHLTGGGL